MTISQISMLVVMTVYLFGMIGVGIKLSDETETVNDFYLGGRKLGPFVTAMSAEASDMSSWLLMGLPGVAYLSGIADAGWTAVGLAFGTYLNWLIVAKRLRMYTAASKSFTVPVFFSHRYGDKKNILTLISAVWIIVFFVPYTASGFAACGKLFNALFGVDYHAAMVVSAIIIMFYTTMGGFLAASMTDFIQSIVMTIALAVILIFGIVTAGGLDAVFANAASLPGYLSITSSYNPQTGKSVSYTALTIASNAAWGLGYFGMPHILLRFMAIEDENKIKLSRRVASVWVVISMAVAVLIGIVGLGMTRVGAVEELSGSNSETIIVKCAHLLSTHGIIPAAVAGIVLSGILASTMSTSDSQLLAASSSVSNDILVNVFKVKFSEKLILTISRISLMVIAFIGVVIAWDPNSSVFSIVSFAWAGFGAAFGPVVLLALFWRRSNKYGAITGMIVGGVMVFVWKYLVSPMGGILGIYELLPSFLIALLVNVLVSLITAAPEKEVVEMFDQVSHR